MRTIFLSIMLVILVDGATASAGEIYVSNFADGDVSVIDSETLSLINRIPVFDPAIGGPMGVAFSSDGRFAFISSNLNEIAVIDTEQQVVTKRILLPPTSGDGSLIFTRPGGDRLYVSDVGGTMMAVLDPLNQEIIDTDFETPEIDGIDILESSWTMGFTPGGLFAYTEFFINSGPRGIQRIDLSLNKLDGVINSPGFGFFAIGVSPNGRIGVGAMRSTIVFIDLVKEAEIARINVEGIGDTRSSLDHLEFNSEGTRLYVNDFGNKYFYVIDTAEPEYPVLLSAVEIDTAGKPFDLVVGNDKAYIIAWRPDQPSEVILMDISHESPIQLNKAPVGVFAFILELRPDGLKSEKMLEEIISLIQYLDLQPGISNSLTKKLNNVMNLLEDSLPANSSRGMQQMEAFLHQVEGLRGVWLNNAEANRLMELAQMTIDFLQKN